MPFAIFALAAINIAIGTQSFVFAGLLSELAGDLDVSIGTAGLLVPASSLTFAVTAPFAASLVSKIERKRVLVAGLILLALCNALCAVAPSFAWLFALRVLGGIVTGFVGSLATIAVPSLVPPERRGRAFAVVVGGLTVALVLWRSPGIGGRRLLWLARDLRIFGTGMPAVGSADRVRSAAHRSLARPARRVCPAVSKHAILRVSARRFLDSRRRLRSFPISGRSSIN